MNDLNSFDGAVAAREADTHQCWATRLVANPNYEAARDVWKREFPEECTVEYTGRGLVDPRCNHHDDDVACWIVNAALGIDQEEQ